MPLHYEEMYYLFLNFYFKIAIIPISYLNKNNFQFEEISDVRNIKEVLLVTSEWRTFL